MYAVPTPDPTILSSSVRATTDDAAPGASSSPFFSARVVPAPPRQKGAVQRPKKKVALAEGASHVMKHPHADTDSKKCRNWVFTVNNPPVDPVTGIAVPPNPLAWPRHVYSIWQLERGETGTLHWQGYVEFSGQFTLSQLKKLPELARAHLEPRRGSADQAVGYCEPNKGGAVRDPTVESLTPLTFGVRKAVICVYCFDYVMRDLQRLVYVDDDDIADGFGYNDLISQIYFLPDEHPFQSCGCTYIKDVAFPPRLKFHFID